MKVDLHLHTVFSDGILDPESLVSWVGACGVGLFSITDHDCLDALSTARRKADELGIKFVNGVELNCDDQGREVHILGYGFNHADPAFEKELQAQREDREVRFKKMMLRLKELGFSLEEKRVREIAGKGSVGRPHLARALIEVGAVRTVDEAFRKYLGHGKPAWVSRNYWTPQAGILKIREAGGVAVLAHPERGGKEMLPELVACGLQGIEVYYPRHTPSMIDKLSKLALQHHLFMTVGSDYHGINPGEKGPGSVDAPEEVIEALLRILVNR